MKSSEDKSQYFLLLPFIHLTGITFRKKEEIFLTRNNLQHTTNIGAWIFLNSWLDTWTRSLASSTRRLSAPISSPRRFSLKTGLSPCRSASYTHSIWMLSILKKNLDAFTWKLPSGCHQYWVFLDVDLGHGRTGEVSESRCGVLQRCRLLYASLRCQC